MGHSSITSTQKAPLVAAAIHRQSFQRSSVPAPRLSPEFPTRDSRLDRPARVAWWHLPTHLRSGDGGAATLFQCFTRQTIAFLLLFESRFLCVWGARACVGGKERRYEVLREWGCTWIEIGLAPAIGDWFLYGEIVQGNRTDRLYIVLVYRCTDVCTWFGILYNDKTRVRGLQAWPR